MHHTCCTEYRLNTSLEALFDKGFTLSKSEAPPEKRPHRGIGRRTPADAYAARAKAGPTRRGIRIDEQHHRVRRDRVDRNGKLTLRHNSRLHHIGLGRRHAGTRVLMLICELDIRIIDENDGQLIRALTLDPSRDYQRQHRTPA